MKLSEVLASVLCNTDRYRLPHTGICGQIGVNHYVLTDSIKAWFEHTGLEFDSCKNSTEDSRTPNYPVIGGRAAYWRAQRAGSMWRGAYGQERKELLRFMIRYYRAMGD